MRKIFAGTMLVLVILLEALSSTGKVYASSGDDTRASYEITEESETDEDEAEVEEDAEVLGEKRKQPDRFVIGIEIAISLTFAIGLIAASHGTDTK